MLDQWLKKRLEDRKQKDLLRTLPEPGTLIDFTSNDYLGLARSETLLETIRTAVDLLPKQNGSTGSRLLSGNSLHAMEVEKKLAGIFHSEAALLFNSGYTANMAVLSSIPQKDDTIIYDELAHASIKDGARLSLAKKYSFRHNDLNDLERKISLSRGRVFIAVESIYSMDGDECPLKELTEISERYGCTLILDEAHSTGVRGPHGSGTSVEKSLHDKIDIRIYTFGKGMGVCGACIAGGIDLIEYLINFSRPFIYTTAPSQHAVASIACAFDFLNGQVHLQEILQQRIQTFLRAAGELPQRTKSLSAIQTLMFPGNKAIRNTARNLQEKGFDVRPILSPTVPPGTERLRICLHTFNAEEEVIALGEALKSVVPVARG
jgi:8-amino-7-oxononanoate synthase